MSSKYVMSEKDMLLANEIEEMLYERDSLHHTVWCVMEGARTLLGAIKNRENNIEWIINDQSTRRMYDLLLKAIENMKKTASREGLQVWNGKKEGIE